MQGAGAIGLGPHDDEFFAAKPRHDVPATAFARGAGVVDGLEQIDPARSTL
jgi:hypothetical protein